MNKRIAAVAAAITVLAALPGLSSESSPLGEEIQTVRGSIAAPTRFIDGEGGWPGLGRRVYNGSAATNGSIMYVFDVDRETWGGAFVIKDVADATNEADLGVYFYEEFGDFGGQASPVTTGEYDARAKGGEVGFVPAGTRKAVVFTRNGVNSTFTYAGYSAPVITLGSDSLDLTVPAGATVEWVNSTEDYAFVRHTPASGPVAFDSSPKPGTGIRVGDSFSYVFEETGTFPYATSTGTGTITVVDGPGVGTPTG